MTGIQIPTESTTGFFNVGTIEGILVLILVIFILKESSKKVVNMIWGFIGLIFVFQVLFILGQTPINDIIPIASFFKFDAFSAVAQLIPWEPAKNVLYTISNFLTSMILSVVNAIIWSWNNLRESITGN